MDTPARNIWKPELYRIQLEAPKPKIIPCKNSGVVRPSFYGKEYHGVISHKEAALKLEEEPNGAFLIRKGSETNDFYTLTWRFNNKIHHYKIYYHGKHYMKDKQYESAFDLVADGLIMMHMELKAPEYILSMMDANTKYTDSPYVTLNRRKLKAFANNNVPNVRNVSNVINDSTLTKEPESLKCDQQDQIDTAHLIPMDVSPSQAENPLVGKYSKAHSFKVHTFKGLNWCEFCANFLWGFTAQGVKCEDCGFMAHVKCSERVPNHCLPDLKRFRGVFGLDLTTLLNAHAATLPFVVRRCVGEIEQRGMASEGIYRVSGFADEIEALKLAFDKEGEAADLSVYSNINVVAGVLKLYLRLLPVPLLTYDAHQHFVSVTYLKTSQEQVAVLRDCLGTLPPAHYNCLQYVIQHLFRVSLLAAVNKMSAHNLSTVFAPTLVAVPPAATDLTAEISALQALIEYSRQVYYPV